MEDLADAILRLSLPGEDQVDRWIWSKESSGVFLLICGDGVATEKNVRGACSG